MDPLLKAAIRRRELETDILMTEGDPDMAVCAGCGGRLHGLNLYGQCHGCGLVRGERRATAKAELVHARRQKLEEIAQQVTT